MRYKRIYDQNALQIILQLNSISKDFTIKYIADVFTIIKHWKWIY